MKKLYFIGICLLWANLAYAQKRIEKPVREPSTTRYLKDLYQYVKEKTRRNQYYTNEFAVNSQSLAWRDKTVRHKSYLFYYSFSGDNKPMLRLAALTIKRDKDETRTEFMFDEQGEVCFALEKYRDNTTANKETQVFYEKGLCINIVLDKEVIDVKNTAPHQEKIDALKRLGKEVYNKFFQDQATAEK